MTNNQLLKPLLYLAVAVLIVVILVYAKPFLVPITFAGLISMLLLPVVKWLQRHKLPGAAAILLAILILVAFFALALLFTGSQIADIGKDKATLTEYVTRKYNDLRQYIAQAVGISIEKQNQLLAQQKPAASGNTGSFLAGFLSSVFGFLANALLVLVYTFLFLYFRGKLKGFIERMAPPGRADEAVKTMNQVQKVSQQYLYGLFLMIVGLWVMYGIGFTIAGVKNPLFFAVLCGLLELVPFVGNLTGTALTLGMSLAQGGEPGVLAGIVITYVLVQFIQTYILEPLVVGAEVQINPLFTIIGLVAGEVLWGIPGLILAIPLLGMGKILCEHIEPLKPYAYLIGNDKKEDKGLKKKIKSFIHKKINAIKKAGTNTHIEQK
jgi:predicted PurR-regulated permease PerM